MIGRGTPTKRPTEPGGIPDARVPFLHTLRLNLPQWMQRTFNIDTASVPRRLSTALDNGQEHVVIQPTFDTIQGGLGNGVLKSTPILIDSGDPIEVLVDTRTVAGQPSKAAIIIAISFAVPVVGAARTLEITNQANIPGFPQLVNYWETFAAPVVQRSWAAIAGSPGATWYVPPESLIFMEVQPLAVGESVTGDVLWFEIPAFVAPY